MDGLIAFYGTVHPAESGNQPLIISAGMDGMSRQP